MGSIHSTNLPEWKKPEVLFHSLAQEYDLSIVTTLQSRQDSNYQELGE